jgi:hypothetical protein
VFDQGPVRRGLDGHSVLRQPKKQLPAMPAMKIELCSTCVPGESAT